MRVLVADDMPMVRKLCSSILRGAGHTVSEAADGLEALDQYAEHHHDVILLDLRMPAMDGVTVLRELNGRGAQAHVVIITAGTDAEIREAISLGARTVVLKPFSRDHLLAAIDRVEVNGRAADVKIYSWASTIDPKPYAPNR